ncbi:MAG: winged helix-turn-helix transcriptional regulator [Archangium sp.]
MSRRELVEACSPSRHIMAKVGDKWSMLVVIALRSGPLRFNELKRAVHHASQRMLTLTLRGLERDGLLTRTVTPTKPPRVDYELTELGHSLRKPVEALGGWAIENQKRIERAQQKYDALTARTSGRAA